MTPGYRSLASRRGLPARLKTLAALASLALIMFPLLGHAQADAPAEPSAQRLDLAWLDHDGRLHAVSLDANGQRIDAKVPKADPKRFDQGRFDQSRFDPHRPVPLGSLWKLLAYAQLVDNGRTESPYVCQGHDPDEVYCCGAGQRVDRGTALWRSCGLYFEPARLDWASMPIGATLNALPAPLAQLRDPRSLQPATRVAPADWLRWLSAWPARTRRQAGDDLLTYWLQGPGVGRLDSVGSRLQVKTFTVASSAVDARGGRWSGASGWIDGTTPVWFAARGTSAQTVPNWAARVLAVVDAEDARVDDDSTPVTVNDARFEASDPRADALAADRSPVVVSIDPADGDDAQPCVDVAFFSRYPIAAIEPAPRQPGVLPAGNYRLRFDATTLAISSHGELTWRRGRDDRPVLSGRFTLDDYVARVIEREGHGEPAAAARALAVAARTYVLAHAATRDGCLAIDDSSATQRVAPRAPSLAARRAAAFTRGLVLDGAVGQYRLASAADSASEVARAGLHVGAASGTRDHAADLAGAAPSPPANVLFWQRSVAQAQAGAGFEAILRTAYPDATLRSQAADGAGVCTQLPQAEHWLALQRARWERTLAGDGGFRSPGPVQVCHLPAGRPFTVRTTGRVYLSGIATQEQRLTLVHEYLHLAFSGHPRGSDEGFVEARARTLMGLE